MDKVLLITVALGLLASLISGSPMDLSGGQTLEEIQDVESQLSIYPSNDEETAALTGPKQVYTDFCITSRDLIMADIKRHTSQLATSVFSLFFRSFGNAGLEALSDEAVNRFAGSAQQEVQSEDLEAGEAMETEGEIMTTPAPEPRSLFRSVMGVLSATGNVVANNVKSTLNNIKANLGLKAMSTVLKDACDKVDNYQREIRAKFEETREMFGEASPVLAQIDLDQLHCVTTDRVLSVSHFCSLVMAAHEPINRVLAFLPTK